MKRALLLIVVPALLVALGFAQTPAASINTDQTNIKGCLGGADGNYTVVEDKTGQIFKITTSGVDLKSHLGHDVTLVGHRASGVSSAVADTTFAVTELNMISEHCVAAVAAPVATASTLVETPLTPTAPAAAPAANVSTPAETAVTPAVAAAAPAVALNTPPEFAVTPAVAATAPAETAVIPAVAAATVSTTTETVSAPAVAAPDLKRLPAPPQRRSARPSAAATTQAATATTPPEPVSTPDATATPPATTASTSSEPVSTPAAVATTPTAPAKRGSLWLLIAFAVLVIVLGILAPSLSKWRKRKALERAGTQNLSFTREASSDKDKDKDDKATPRRVA